MQCQGYFRLQRWVCRDILGWNGIWRDPLLLLLSSLTGWLLLRNCEDVIKGTPTAATSEECSCEVCTEWWTTSQSSRRWPDSHLVSQYFLFISQNMHPVDSFYTASLHHLPTTTTRECSRWTMTEGKDRQNQTHHLILLLVCRNLYSQFALTFLSAAERTTRSLTRLKYEIQWNSTGSIHPTSQIHSIGIRLQTSKLWFGFGGTFGTSLICDKMVNNYNN